MKTILDPILTGIGLSLLTILFAFAIVTALFLYPLLIIINYFRPSRPLPPLPSEDRRPF